MSRDIARHVSPDGSLTFVIVSDGDDITLGFEGYKSHTHADIISALSGKPKEIAVAEYVSALLNNRAAIAIRTVGNRIDDIWVCDDPNKPDPYKPADEVTIFRLWDGTLWQPVS